MANFAKIGLFSDAHKLKCIYTCPVKAYDVTKEKRCGKFCLLPYEILYQQSCCYIGYS